MVIIYQIEEFTICKRVLYSYSNEKAKEALNILTDKQIEEIKLSLFKGGENKDE